MNDEMFTVSEVSDFLRVSPPTVYKLIGAGDFPHIRVGYRVLIPKAAFGQWLAQHTFGGDPVAR